MRLVFTPLPGVDGSPPRHAAARLDRPVLFFGRHPDCDVNPPGTVKVSRRHCCVAEASGKVRVRDLGSMNGTFVNDRPVRREAPLKVGDVLRVGDVRWRLEPVRAAVDPALSGVVRVPRPAAADAAPPPPKPAPVIAAANGEEDDDIITVRETPARDDAAGTFPDDCPDDFSDSLSDVVPLDAPGDFVPLDSQPPPAGEG